MKEKKLKPRKKMGRPRKYPGGSVQVYFFLPKEHEKEARENINQYLARYKEGGRYTQTEIKFE